MKAAPSHPGSEGTSRVDARSVLVGAVTGLSTCWLALATTDLLYKLVAFLVLTPLAGVVLSLSLWLGGSTVLADQDILAFALSPVGLVSLVLAAAVSLTVVVLEQACLITIGVTAAEGTPVTQMTAVWHAVSRAPAVIGLIVQLLWRAMLTSAPFLSVIGGSYVVFLGDYDINYYLSERPPDLWICAVSLIKDSM